LSTHLHLGLPSGLFSLWLSHQYPICISPHSCYMPCPSHPPWHGHSNYNWRRVQVMKLYFLKHLWMYVTLSVEKLNGSKVLCPQPGRPLRHLLCHFDKLWRNSLRHYLTMTHLQRCCGQRICDCSIVLTP
jgi:hypothetical protein